jgi:hypothetical protein
LLGIEKELRDVRECIRSTDQAMREAKRGKSKNLIHHWQIMLDLFHDRERDLMAIGVSRKLCGMSEVG